MNLTLMTATILSITLTVALALPFNLQAEDSKKDGEQPRTIRVSKEQLAQDEAELQKWMNSPEAQEMRDQVTQKQNFMNRCSGQLKKVCRGSNATADCLDKGLKALDPDCRKMVSGQLESMNDQSKEFVSNCQESILRLCPLDPEKYLANPNQGNKNYKECLIKNKANFPPKCSKSLGALWTKQGGATAGNKGAMARKNPCVADMKKYCPYNRAKARKNAGSYMIEHQRCINHNKHFFSEYCRRHLKNRR
ncbi:MAG: hypothetical protein HN353_07335 [Bdellovibrionales bacterium]|jgi:hypothetical protein|nr:hypothetical protein [Bdellovibrionales bacterium]MBT3526623.1 hypothetical protein [Bdellovibrionales bacterium]MBT7668618.1 hypothetical protein [Bdellovibrionales bacterium]MBT7766649.1 hypothetical protein [Bdellovibrionales bacterium]